MKKNTMRWLDYKEELALSVFFSNVEKFKALANLPIFKITMLTEPMKIYDEDAPALSTILFCYKILYSRPGYEKMAQRNDEIIDILHKKGGLIVPHEMDLSEYNPSGPGDILAQKEYGPLLKRVQEARRSGYAPGEESWDRLTFRYRYVVIDALREQHLERLGRGLSKARKESILNAIREQEEDACRQYLARHKPTLSAKVKSFIDNMDRPGSVVALFDNGKGFYNDVDAFEAVIRHILSETRFIVLRVGGNSYRAEGMAYGLSREIGNDPARLESIYCGHNIPEDYLAQARATCHRFYDYNFNYEDDFVRYAERYDKRNFTFGGETHPMVYYYVNNIDTGWYDKKGRFTSFNDKDKGLQALGDVAMICGYADIKPATAAIVASLRYGPDACQRRLAEDAGIPFLDICRGDF